MIPDILLSDLEIEEVDYALDNGLSHSFTIDSLFPNDL